MRGRSGFVKWTPVRIAGVYVVLGALWIAASDTLVVHWVPDIARMEIYSTLKGVLFALVTGLLLLLLLKLEARARARVQATQQRSQAQFRRVFDDAPFAAIVHAEGTEGGEIVAVNRTWLQLSGYTQDQIPTIAAWVQRAYEDDEVRQTVLAEVARLYSLEDRWEGGEFTITTATGEKRVWQFSSSPLGRDETGRRLVMSMAVDVTTRKDTEQRLQQAKIDADQANSAKDRFLAVLSHELRTPLTPVLAALSDMEDNPRFAPSVREEIAVMRQNIQTESRLIDDLLDLSRIVHAKLHLELQPVSIATALGRSIKVCSLDIAAKSLYVQNDIRDDLEVMGDPCRLQQVFCNIISNAIKFTPRHGRIAIRCSSEGQNAVVEISDTGVGISPHMLPRMFDAFQQADQHVTRTLGGLGLGLAISKSLVQAHGGQITIDSQGQGKGASVRIVLPQHLPSPVPAAAFPSASQPALPHSKSTGRILLVEDHLDTAKLLLRILTSKGHQVQHASTVAQAIQTLAASEFDLLVSDIGLPDGTGLDVMRAARAQVPDLPGVAISGYGMDDDLERSQQAGFATHLIKPVNIRSLHAAIGNVLGQSRTKCDSAAQPAGL